MRDNMVQDQFSIYQVKSGREYEYSGRQNASVRTCRKQRSGGRKAPLEQLNRNAYPVGFPVKALSRQRCLQPLLERLQDIGFEKAASTSPEWCFPYPGQLLENAP